MRGDDYSMFFYTRVCYPYQEGITTCLYRDSHSVDDKKGCQTNSNRSCMAGLVFSSFTAGNTLLCCCRFNTVEEITMHVVLNKNVFNSFY